MIDHLYGFIALIWSEFDQLQKGPNNPREKNKPVPEGDPTIPEVRRTNQANSESELKGGPVRQQAVSLQRWSISQGLESDRHPGRESNILQKAYVKSLACVEKKKCVQHGKFSERDFIWGKN